MGNMKLPGDPRILDLALIENLPPGLTERALIDNALEFANSGDLEAFRAVSGPYELMSLPKQFYEEVRSAVRMGLTNIIKARKDNRDAPADAAKWRELRTRVLLAADEGGGQHLIFLDALPRAPGGRAGKPDFEPTAPFAYVLLLLLDAEKPYRRKLCQCNLRDCGKFFFAKLPKNGTGRPQTEYCPDSNHRELAHRATAPERVRHSRERRKRAAKHK
jgi:hypothetical protein